MPSELLVSSRGQPTGLAAPRSQRPGAALTDLTLADPSTNRSVREAACAYDTGLEALHVRLGAHRLRRAYEQRSGGAGRKDPIAGRLCGLTCLLVVVSIVGDLNGNFHSRAGCEYDRGGTKSVVALGRGTDLMCVGAPDE
jgi:hypothetical protein